MTVPGRAKQVRRNRRSASQMIVAGLVVLAVVASLLLIFSESVQLLRVGLVVALWAATLGAIAMTKYRRESALDKAKVRDLQKVYELQLEREITARREYELGVEVRVRGELGAEAETIAALREELAALRKNLEVLFDGRLPEDRVALRAESMRVQEIAGGYQPAASGLFVPGAEKPARNDNQPPAPRGPSFATPFDEPMTAETTVVQPEPLDVEAVDDEAEKAQPKPAPEPQPAPEPEPEPNPVQERKPEPEPEPEPESESQSELDDSARPTSRRSRRLSEDAEPAGAHSSGLSVAEIMANMKSAESSESAPRRRRRAE
ncbi:hypothetical protein GS473_05265 [Rhodococcus hoagii]|uniref:DUF6779 domain-containing protein n=1 Tax=Rhodococcus hoagii TaxID=43767 RepID=UPI000A122874|nr:DUF6779 domain-containing protein [Prescottella equi]NKR96348.1 hypothetical protein [Prescottella equi]ORL24815.1 hypothetical protein A6I87_20020 [Prescottella equi]